jgi:hypothetical protein
VPSSLLPEERHATAAPPPTRVAAERRARAGVTRARVR